MNDDELKARQDMNGPEENDGINLDFIDISEEDLEHADEDIASALAMLERPKSRPPKTGGKKPEGQEIVEGEEHADFPEESQPESRSDEKPSVELKEKISAEIKQQYEDQITKLQKTLSGYQKKINSDAKEIETLKTKSEELNTHWVRVSADYQNYQKRIKTKFHEFIELERINLVREILPVIDDFKRAFENTFETSGFREGMELIFRQLLQVLSRWDVTEIDALGKPFDPVFHEAIDRAILPDQPDNQVVNVYLTGYSMGSRVIRPAKVVVNCTKQYKSGPAVAAEMSGQDATGVQEASQTEISDDNSGGLDVESNDMSSNSESSRPDASGSCEASEGSDSNREEDGI